VKKRELSAEMQNLPDGAVDFIERIIRKMRYRKKIRVEVEAELAGHFADELKDCANDEAKEKRAQELITEFGDVKLLGVLLRRAKKRCRPVWRSVVVRSLQGLGIFVVLLIAYSFWFVSGKPTINIDYVAIANRINRPEALDENNAWGHYVKATELFIEPGEEIKHVALTKWGKHPPNFEELDEGTKGKIIGWVEQNKASWGEFVAGSMKPYCYIEYGFYENTEDNWLISIVLPPLGNIRHVATLGLWQNQINREAGQTQQALDNCLAIIRCGKHLVEKKLTLIEQLVGLAINALGHDEILNIVAEKELNAVALKQLQQQLMDIYTSGFPMINTEGQRLMFLDTVQHIFTKGGPGGGHLIPSYLNFIRPYKASIDVQTKELELMAESMFHAGRDKTVAKAKEIYDRLNELSKMNPYEKRVRNVNLNEIIRDLRQSRYFVIYFLVPPLERAFDITYGNKSLHEATVVVLAMRRWRLERGGYPERLSELVTAGFLDKVPMDPYSDGELVYKRSDGDFLLYSFGLNFADDGGTVTQGDARDQRYGSREAGDMVFWPME